MKNGGSFHSYVKLPEGTHDIFLFCNLNGGLTVLPSSGDIIIIDDAM